MLNLDLMLQEFALGGDHRTAQLLEDQPSSLVARQTELALELPGGDPRMVRGDQIGCPEPRPQRRVCPVHHRPRRRRGLLSAVLALPQQPAAVHLARPH